MAKINLVGILFIFILLVSVTGQNTTIDLDSNPEVDSSVPVLNEVSRVVNREADNVNMDILGSLLFVADGPGGFKIVNTSNPVSPEIVYRYNITTEKGLIWDLKIIGQTLYVANYDLLQIFDLSTPTAPQLLSETKLDDYMGSIQLEIEVSGSYVFMAGYFNDLYIYNIADPNAPVSVFTNTSNFMSLELNNNYLYLTDSNDDLYVYDISTPNSPVEVDRVPLGGRGLDMSVDNDRLYVAVDGIGIRIYDISTGSLIEITTISHSSTYRSVRVHARGNVLMFTGSGYSRTAYNVSDLPNIGTYSTMPYQDGYSSFYINDTRLYMGSEDTGDITIVDISDLEVITTSGKIKDINDEFIDVQINNDVAYWASSYDGLFIYNITNPSSPLALSFYPISDGEQILDLTYHNDTVYLVTYNDVLVLDVSDPKTPISNGILPCTGLNSEEVAIQNDTLFLGCFASIEAYDISSPASPIYLGSYTPADSNSFEFLRFYEDYLVAVTDFATVEVINVTDTGSMFNISYLDLPYSLYDIEINGTDLFLTTKGLNNHLISLDLVNPTNPVVTEFDYINSEADLAIYGEYILTPGTFGMNIFKLNSSGLPVELDYWSYQLDTFSVTVKNYEMAFDDGYLYISTVEGGIIIENFMNDTSDESDPTGDPPGDKPGSPRDDGSETTSTPISSTPTTTPISSPPQSSDTQDDGVTLSPPFFWLVSVTLIITYLTRKYRNNVD